MCHHFVSTGPAFKEKNRIESDFILTIWQAYLCFYAILLKYSYFEFKNDGG